MTISTLLTRSLFTALLLPLGMPNVLLAQVTPANDGTGTVVNTSGNQFNIEGGTLSGNGANLFHSLEKLGLNRDQIANFLANPQVQNILTRVVGGDASIINGLIQVAGGNANLYLMNPAGVIFGPNAMINVPGDFVVTTATGIGFGNDQWFKTVGSNDYQTLIGNPSQFAFDLANPGAIFNGGNLTVGEGKNISLIGGTVLNTGTISAPGGDITIAAIPGTSRVKISKAGNLVSLEVELSPNPDKSQKINPLDLPTLLTEGAIFPENTETNLAQGSVITEGVISAAGTQGGQVALVGQQVSVSKGSIDVSGVNGGGRVRVGGDYQGKGSIPNATTTLVDEKSQIKADGLGQGDGGKVIVWADGNTQFDGKISAKGGLLGGNGGFVEVSGKEKLRFNGFVDLSANKGNLGTLLLDPTDVRIYRSPDTGDIDASSLESTSGDVVVNADNDITIADNVSLDFVNGTGSITFTADADNNGTGDFSMSTSQSINALGRNLTISGATITAGVLNTSSQNNVGVNGGDITLTATNGSVTAIQLSSASEAFFIDGNAGTGGNVEVNATGDISIQGKNGGTGSPAFASILSQSESFGTNNNSSNAGNISLKTTGGNITIGGEVDTRSQSNGGGTTGNGGNVSLISNNGNITINGLIFSPSSSSKGDVTIKSSGQLNLNSSIASVKDVEISANEINFTGDINGTGNLTLQPFTTNRNIAISTADNNDSNQLNLTTSEINNLQNGFSSITIGRSDSSGTINVAGNVTFNDPVTLRSPSGGSITQTGGSINISNDLFTLDVTGDISLSNNNNDFNTVTITKGQNVTLTDANSINLNTATTTGNFTVNAGQDIILNPNSAISTGTKNVQFNAARAITLNSGSKITTTSGSIELNGNKDGKGVGNFIGILLDNSSVITSQKGNITLFGRGGNTANPAKGNDGIGTGTNTIETGGNIDLTGIGGEGGGSSGIDLYGSSINTTGTGNINITGTGGTGTTSNEGILIYNGGQIQSSGGYINLIGIGKTGTSSEGITGKTTGSGTGTIGSATTTGDITLNTDTINLNNLTIQGSGKLTLQPDSASTSIGIGDSATGTFNLDSSELNTIQDGFNSMTIGRSDSTSEVNVAGNVTFNDPVTLRSPFGSINVNNTITGQDASITLQGITNLKANLTTNNQNITIDGNTNLGANSTLTGSNVTFKGIINGANSLTVNASGITDFQQAIGGTTALNSLTTDAAGTTQINGNVTTTGSQIYNDTVEIQNSVTLTTTNSNIAFNKTVDSQSGEANDLTLNSGTGNISFNDSVGNTTSLGNLSVNSNGITSFNSSVNAASLTTDSVGTTNINGNITTTGTQTYKDTVEIQNPVMLSTANSEISFANKVNSQSEEANNLTLSSGTGNVSFNDLVGNTTALGNLSVNSSGKTLFNKTVKAASLTTDASSQINGDITTTGSQKYNNTVEIQNPVTLSTTNSDITFADKVNSQNGEVNDLSINSGTGNVSFNDSVGESNGLGNVSVNSSGTTRFNNALKAASLTTDAEGSSQINGDIITTGNQTYNDTIEIQNPVTLSTTNSNITFNKTVDSQSGEANDLTLNSGTGNISFNDSVGNTKALGNLSVNSGSTTLFNNTVKATSLTTDSAGSSQINGDIITTGNQTYNDTVEIQNPVTLTTTNSNITFNKTVDSQSGEANGLTLNSGTGNISFNDSVGNTTALGNVSVNSSGTTLFNNTVKATSLTTDSAGTTNINANITTSGDQTFGDAVNLQADTSLTSANTTFNNIVTGDRQLTIKASEATTFNGEVNVGKLTTDEIGTTNINSNITTTGDQIFGDAVTLQTDTILSSVNTTFNKTVTGDHQLTINASGTTFNGAVNVGKLTTDSVGSTNINADITTTRDQTFNDEVNLGTDTTLSSINTTFNKTVTGDRQLTIKASEATTFNGEVNVGKLTTDEIGTTKINSNITTTEDQTFGDAVTLQTDTILSSVNTTFNKTVTGDHQLTVNASGTTRFNDAVNISNLTTDAVGTTEIKGNITTTGNQTYNDAVTLQGNTTLTGTDINLQKIVNGNQNLIVNALGKTTVEQAINTKGTLTLNGSTNLNADLTTQGQDLNINGNVTLGKSVTISTGSTANSGNINVTGNIQGSHSLNLQAGKNLNTQNIDLSNTNGTAATLALTATSGSINTGNLNTAGSTNGGDITIKAKTAITTGAITTSGQKAGNVFIDPDNDIQVGYINAQSTNGVGGNIDITTARFFRATQTFVDQNGVTASLSSAGSQGGGTITIRNGGGTTPFIVGDANINGTRGAITSGQFTINPTQSYFFNETVDNISLLNGIDAPTPNNPISTPNNPISTPNNPISTPNNPISTPNNPISTPNNPISTPNNPISTPNNPISTTDILEATILTSPNQQQSSSLPSLSNSLNTFTPPSLQSSTVVAVQDIDQNFTTDYSNQLGLPSKPEIPLDNIPTILASVQQVTGVKSALIYVFFRSAKSESLTENSSLWELNRARNSTTNTERKNDDQLEVVLVSDQNILPLSIQGVTREQVLKASLQLQQNLTNIAPIEDFLPQSKQLYQWLITPIEDALKNQKITNLTFVLDQGLRSLPLAALYDADSQQYIIEKYSVSLIPSLSLTDTTRQDRKGAKVLGMGADTFSDQNPLPAVPTELTEIAKNIWPGQIFLNQDFTVENFKNALNSNQFSIVHLATHGEFKSGDRNNSFVVFSDKKLTLDEFANLGLDRPIDLLTLSACQTALGDPDAELGFAGLAVKTGVRTALGSLWYVSDAGTLALMTSFYNELKEAPTKADALRQAQLSLLHKKVSLQKNQMLIGDNNRSLSISVPLSLRRNFKNMDTSHPYYWSAFTLIGNPW